MYISSTITCYTWDEIDYIILILPISSYENIELTIFLRLSINGCFRYPLSNMLFFLDRFACSPRLCCYWTLYDKIVSIFPSQILDINYEI